MSRAAFIFRSAFGSSIRAILRMVGMVRALRSWLSLMPSFSLAALTCAFSSLLRYISACGKLIRISSQVTIANNIIAQRLSTVNKLSPPRGGGGYAGLSGGGGSLLQDLHEFQDRSSPLVPAKHRFLPALGPFVPILGGAFGGEQVGPPRESPVSAMRANKDRC